MYSGWEILAAFWCGVAWDCAHQNDLLREEDFKTEFAHLVGLSYLDFRVHMNAEC